MLPRLVTPLAAALAASALASSAPTHDWLVCAPSALPFSPGASARLSITNNAASFVSVSLCTGPGGGGGGGGACSAAVAAASCPQVLPGNATSYLNISAAGVTGVLISYHSTTPFSWHALASAPTLALAWPPAGGIADVTLTAPATPGLLMCDGDGDCPAGAGPCAAAPAPPRCAQPRPPAPSAYPSFVPLPTPARGPPAATCNLTRNWQQSNTSTAAPPHALRHVADAYITVTAGAAPGAFSWSCVASRAPCPGGHARLNGTGVLSAADGTFTLTPVGAPAVAGSINSTYSCQPLWLPAWGVQWTSMDPVPAAAADLAVSAATFLGAGGALLAPVGVAILSAPAAGAPAIVAVAVNGRTDGYPGVTPQLLLNATSGACNGSVLILSVPAAGPPAVLRVLALGMRVDHARASGAGALAVAGSFGVAVLHGAAAGPATVAWADALADVEQSGGCGACCAGDGATFCRLDIGEDGAVAARLAAAAGSAAGGAAAGAGDLLWAAWSAAGARMATGAARGAATLTAVYVDAARARLGVGYFYNSNTGREPMVMPRVDVYSYAGAAELVLLAWSASVYRSAGPCNGHVADGRVEDLRLARDGTLLLAGRSDGGDSPYACGLRDSNRSIPFVSYDSYNTGANMQAQAITNLMKVDAGTGEAAVGQLQLTRLPSSRGNTLITHALHGDAGGYTYQLQAAGFALPPANRTINGLPLAGQGDCTALLIASPALARRHWTHFVRAGADMADSGRPVDVDVRGGAAALLLSSSADLVQVNALPGSAANVNGTAVAYLVVMPTIGGEPAEEE